jgi:MFS family permease
VAVAVSVPAPTLPAARRAVAELPLLACWLNVVVAAAAQMATIPGRVYGLGLITEPLLNDLSVSRTTFGLINLWATIVTAVVCVGFGTVLTHLGTRRTHHIFMLGLAGATALLTVVHGTWMLFLAICLARVLGQGMLALVSTSMVGKSFPRKVVLVMAVYSIVVAGMYGGLVQLIKIGMAPSGLHLSWREVWLVIAALLAFGLVPLGFFAISEPRRSDGSEPDAPQGVAPELTLRQAVRSPVFILFGLSCLVTGTANAGIALFNESLFKDRGFSREVFFDSLTIGIVGVLVFKVVAAWLCDRWSMRMMSALCMLLYAGTALAVPFLETTNQVYAWSVAKSVAISIHTVIYFAIWSYAFGRRDLAQIQGAAHVLTVTASGLGPVVFGLCRDRLGTYDPCMYAAAAAAFAVGAAMLFVPVPCAERPIEAESWASGGRESPVEEPESSTGDSRPPLA